MATRWGICGMFSLARTGAAAGASAWSAALVGSLGACLVEEVPSDRYADASAYAEQKDAGAMEGGAPAEDGGARDAEEDPGDASAPEDSGTLPPDPDCDFTGRWLVTERLVVTGLGIQQATLWWLYLDVAQSAGDLRVAKGLVCGTAANRVGSLGVMIDMHESWPAIQAKNEASGREGKAALVSGRCQVQWDRAYRALGVSIHISGVLNGTRYSASRLWTSYAGGVEKRAERFRLSMDWNQEESVLGVTTDALKAAGVKDANPKLHFAYFARLSDSQANGDDDAICASVRALAPTLTADAY